jgi:hypothetical protein
MRAHQPSPFWTSRVKDQARAIFTATDARMTRMFNHTDMKRKNVFIGVYQHP